MTATVHAIEPYLTQRESDERHAACELEAWDYFKRATVAQQSEYDTTMAANRFLSGNAWKRRRAAAKARFAATTREADALYERTLASLLETGEVPEELSFEWDRLIEREAFEQSSAVGS